jgi:hypothetical protein
MQRQCRLANGLIEFGYGNALRRKPRPLQERNPIQQRPVAGAVVTKLFRLVWLKKTQQAS